MAVPSPIILWGKKHFFFIHTDKQWCVFVGTDTNFRDHLHEKWSILAVLKRHPCRPAPGRSLKLAVKRLLKQVFTLSFLMYLVSAKNEKSTKRQNVCIRLSQEGLQISHGIWEVLGWKYWIGSLIARWNWMKSSIHRINGRLHIQGLLLWYSSMQMSLVDVTR